VVVAGVVAVFVSVGTMTGQKIIDDVRAERDHRISDQQNQRAERLENLRFIRGRSNTDPNVERPFYGLDLAGLSLSGLDLPGANFSEADLQGCDLLSTNLQGANLSYAKLANTILLGVDLRSANLVGAEFIDVTIDNEKAAHPAPGGRFQWSGAVGGQLRRPRPHRCEVHRSNVFRRRLHRCESHRRRLR
jgi:hypothetical protein